MFFAKNIRGSRILKLYENSRNTLRGAEGASKGMEKESQSEESAKTGKETGGSVSEDQKRAIGNF